MVQLNKPSLAMDCELALLASAEQPLQLRDCWCWECLTARCYGTMALSWRRRTVAATLFHVRQADYEALLRLDEDVNTRQPVSEAQIAALPMHVHFVRVRARRSAVLAQDCGLA